jgi:hypothetical protein
MKMVVVPMLVLMRNVPQTVIQGIIISDAMEQLCLEYALSAPDQSNRAFQMEQEILLRT